MKKRSIGHILNTSASLICIVLYLFLVSFAPAKEVGLCDTLRIVKISCDDDGLFSDIEQILHRSEYYEESPQGINIVVLSFLHNRDHDVKNVICDYSTDFSILEGKHFVNSYLEHNGNLYFLNKNDIPVRYVEETNTIKEIVLSSESKSNKKGCSILLHKNKIVDRFLLKMIHPRDLDYLFSLYHYHADVEKKSIRINRNSVNKLRLNEYSFSSRQAQDVIETAFRSFFIPSPIKNGQHDYYYLYTAPVPGVSDQELYYMTITKLPASINPNNGVVCIDIVKDDDSQLFLSSDSFLRIDDSIILFSYENRLEPLMCQTGVQPKFKLICKQPEIFKFTAGPNAMTFKIVDTSAYLTLLYAE